MTTTFKHTGAGREGERVVGDNDAVFLNGGRRDKLVTNSTIDLLYCSQAPRLFYSAAATASAAAAAAGESV